MVIYGPCFLGCSYCIWCSWPKSTPNHRFDQPVKQRRGICGTLSATNSLCLTARCERCAIWCSRSSSWENMEMLDPKNGAWWMNRDWIQKKWDIHCIHWQKSPLKNWQIRKNAMYCFNNKKLRARKKLKTTKKKAVQWEKWHESRGWRTSSFDHTHLGIKECRRTRFPDWKWVCSWGHWGHWGTLSEQCQKPF